MEHPNYKGLFMQQCSKCGHDSHYPFGCGIGFVRFIPLSYDSEIGQQGVSIGCECLED